MSNLSSPYCRGGETVIKVICPVLVICGRFRRPPGRSTCDAYTFVDSSRTSLWIMGHLGGWWLFAPVGTTTVPVWALSRCPGGGTRLSHHRNWREYFAWPAFSKCTFFNVGNSFSNSILILSKSEQLENQCIAMMRKSALLVSQFLFRGERRRSWLWSQHPLASSCTGNV